VESGRYKNVKIGSVGKLEGWNNRAKKKKRIKFFAKDPYKRNYEENKIGLGRDPARELSPQNLARLAVRRATANP